jgi:pimeloyl-ACP methyl ester carboxylesterase
VEPPETRYAWNGEDALAYQVFGQSAPDLVYLQGYASNVVLQWEHPGFVRFAEALARFVRVIVTDRRGLGCSDSPRETFHPSRRWWTTYARCSTRQARIAL